MRLHYPLHPQQTQQTRSNPYWNTLQPAAPPPSPVRATPASMPVYQPQPQAWHDAEARWRHEQEVAAAASTPNSVVVCGVDQHQTAHMLALQEQARKYYAGMLHATEKAAAAEEAVGRARAESTALLAAARDALATSEAHKAAAGAAAAASSEATTHAAALRVALASSRAEQDEAVEQRERAMEKLAAMTAERDAARVQVAELAAEVTAMRHERDAALTERDAARTERDAAQEELDSARFERTMAPFVDALIAAPIAAPIAESIAESIAAPIAAQALRPPPTAAPRRPMRPSTVALLSVPAPRPAATAAPRVTAPAAPHVTAPAAAAAPCASAAARAAAVVPVSLAYEQEALLSYWNSVASPSLATSPASSQGAAAAAPSATWTRVASERKARKARAAMLKAWGTAPPPPPRCVPLSSDATPFDVFGDKERVMAAFDRNHRDDWHCPACAKWNAASKIHFCSSCRAETDGLAKRAREERIVEAMRARGAPVE